MRDLRAIALAMLTAGCPKDEPPPSGADGGTCASGTDCEGECIDPSSDPDHCGSCDVRCGEDAPNCAAGSCVADCGGQLARCGGSCVSLASDPAHCGSCDHECPPDAPSCAGGECVSRCPDGSEPCGAGECADLEADPRHCGQCDRACGAAERCEAGACLADEPCKGGEDLCDGRCVTLADDRDHCGACGRSCEDGQACEDGACACSGDACEDCEFPETDCDPDPGSLECRDLSADADHCGSCDRACADGQECVEGACACAGEGCDSCGEGEDDCDPDPGALECRDLSNDHGHCGACDSPCEDDHDCIGGECQCPADREECGGLCVDTTTDVENCGGCDRPCGGDCQDGQCTLNCGGLDECFGEYCADLSNDRENCGECGQVCTGDEICVGGECTDVLPVFCNECPCDDCPDLEDPPQSCCEDAGGVICVASGDCPDEG